MVFLLPGYIIHTRQFTGGASFNFDFEMRTQLRSGLLFFAYGAENVFFLIQLVSGGLHVEYSDDGPREVLLVPGSETINICDGQWHSIEVEKRGQLISATIDHNGPVATGSESLKTELWLASELYIGGIEPGSDAMMFIVENDIGDRLQRSE